MSRRRRSVQFPLNVQLIKKLSGGIVALTLLTLLVYSIPPFNIYIILGAHALLFASTTFFLYIFVNIRTSLLVACLVSLASFLYVIDLFSPMNIIIAGSLVVSLGLFMHQK